MNGEIAAYSLATRSFRSLGIRGRGPHWLVEDKILLFLRGAELVAYEAGTGVSRVLRVFPEFVTRRFAVSGPRRTIYFKMGEARVEFWLAVVK